MAWHAALSLHYETAAGPSRAPGRTLARFVHEGPLRILKSFHPEGDAICHNVLVHPPGGLVAGDSVAVDLRVGPGAHGLVTTPGATQFYRADTALHDGAVASQHVEVTVAAGGRLEWLPLEAICHAGCVARNRLVARLAPGAEMIGWDLTALGLPASSGRAFDRGSIEQHLELRIDEGSREPTDRRVRIGSDERDDRRVWLERGVIDASDRRLMDGPPGLAGHRCVATLFFAAGTALDRDRREIALDMARQAIARTRSADPAWPPPVTGMTRTTTTAGATAPGPHVIAVRILAPMVEPAFHLARAVRDAWRTALWQLPATAPRGWPRD